MTEPRSFGAWLRREREARSIPLRAIADRTKIGPGLLEALERGDISRWPGGIYRRAFVRAYAVAIGLDGDRVVESFERAFPPDPSFGVTPQNGPMTAAPAAELRLALAAPAVSAVHAHAIRTAVRDLACIAAAGGAGLALAGWVGFWCVAALTAIAFHLSRVFGISYKAAWREAMQKRRPAPLSAAEVVDFPGQPARRARVRARRLLADLSAAATSAGIPGRRRAARS